MPHRTGSSNSGNGSNGLYQNQYEDRVVDFKRIRSERLNEKRRKAERIFFNYLIGVYGIAEEDRLHPLELIEVSETGCSFQIPFNPKKPWPSELKDISVRL